MIDNKLLETLLRKHDLLQVAGTAGFLSDLLAAQRIQRDWELVQRQRGNPRN
jgi:hypothetical protein